MVAMTVAPPGALSYPNQSTGGVAMISCRRLVAVIALMVLAVAWHAPADAAPEGQLTWAVHTTLVPGWFDPVDMPSVITPFMVLYALHDALVKPMPGKSMTPGLAESWTASPDGLVYDFVL